MSILIKGMKIPENCILCPIIIWNDEDDYVCPFSGISALNIGRQDDCPLIEVPPHGDLIDRDKLREKEYFNYADADAVVMSRDIRNTPAIIPADKDGDKDD